MRIITLLPLVVVLGVVACGETEPPEVQQQVLDECPKVWGRTWAEQEIMPLPIREGVPGTVLSGPGALQDIPEFHDCQRFATGETLHGPGDYSRGIFAIFAVGEPTLAGQRFPDRSTVYDADEAQGLARPAAQIFAEAGYEPLGISEGLNCVYLYKNAGRWGAAIRWDRKKDNGCRNPIDTARVREYRPLTVTRERFPRVGSDPYPPVARWTWHMDQTKIETRMGVPCDDGWCEISRFGPATEASQSKAHPVVYDEADEEQRRVHLVKAWYDEQLLAVESGNSLVPSGILGTIFPDPALGRHEEEAFDNTWVKAADVALTPMDVWYSGENPYQGKMNLSLSHDTGGNLNSISLCHGEWRSCVGSSAIPEPPSCGTPEQSDPLWWAKVESSTGQTEYHCVFRCGYSVQIPGTVRWSWRADDEGIWMRCVNGCCEIGPGVEGEGD